MANIYLKDCSDTEVAQKWLVQADGRIALEASTSPRKHGEPVHGEARRFGGDGPGSSAPARPVNAG